MLNMIFSSRHSMVYLVYLISWLQIAYCQTNDQEEQQRLNPRVSQRNTGITNSHVDEQVCNDIALNALDFAHTVALQLTNADGVYSEVFSPVSIMAALTLLMLGAKDSSYDELKTLLNMNNDPIKFFEQFGYMLQDLQQSNINNLIAHRERPNWTQTMPKHSIRRPSTREKIEHYEYMVKLANGVFAQEGFKLNTDYRRAVSMLYKSEIQQLDFQRNPGHARAVINNWVESNTFGKIMQIISGEISQNTNVIIGSALYFKGFWENPFYESATDWDNFYPDGPQQPAVKVKMMATGGVFPFYDAKEYNCRIIGLPYKGNLTTMYIIQPNNSSRYNLEMLHRNINAKVIEDMISKMVRSSALVAFPKMKFERTHNMKYTLSRLGVRTIFRSGLSDLSLISDTASMHTPSETGRFGIAAMPSTAGTDPTAAMSQLKDRFGEKPQFFSRSSIPENENIEILQSLESKRATPTYNKPNLFVEDILHKVVFDVNEHGTEAAAATLAVLFRSGTDILFRADSPFILLIRHDLTKLPLFYGLINEPILN